MKAQWQRLKNRFEAFEIRERLLITAVLLAFVYLTWDIMILSGFRSHDQLLVARERVATQGIQALKAEQTVLTQVTLRDPNIEIQREIDELKEKLVQLDQELSHLAVGLIPARELPQVMHGILSQTGKLKLEKMTTLPPQEITLSGRHKNALVEAEKSPGKRAAAQAGADQSSAIGIYKQTVVMDVVGDFTSIVEYLKALESSQWRFYWEALDYQVMQHPKAKVQIRVFTLSSERGLLDGV